MVGSNTLIYKFFNVPVPLLHVFLTNEDVNFDRTITFKVSTLWQKGSLSFEWNSIRLGGLAHGIVTKTVYKTLPGFGRGQGGIGVGGWGSRVDGVKGVVGWVGGLQGWWESRGGRSLGVLGWGWGPGVVGVKG